MDPCKYFLPLWASLRKGSSQSANPFGFLSFRIILKHTHIQPFHPRFTEHCRDLSLISGGPGSFCVQSTDLPSWDFWLNLSFTSPEGSLWLYPGWRLSFNLSTPSLPTLDHLMSIRSGSPTALPPFSLVCDSD